MGTMKGMRNVTRSGPKIPAAGYSEEERFLGVNNLSFGLLALKMALKAHNEQ